MSLAGENRSHWPRRLEISANIAILAVAIMAAVIFVRGSLAFRSRAPKSVGVGAKISLPGEDWSKTNRTVVFVLSTSCRFCVESSPFYRRLLREFGGRQDIRFLAVLANDVEDAKRFLSEQEIPVRDVRQASLYSVGVYATPTVMLVDKSGAVIQTWVGKLSAERESQVIARIVR